MRHVIWVVRTYPEFFCLLGALQWLFPGLLGTMFYWAAHQVGVVMGSLTSVFAVSATETLVRTVITGAGDALAAAEAYDQEAHQQATQALGRSGGFLYETIRTRGCWRSLWGLLYIIGYRNFNLFAMLGLFSVASSA